MILLLKLLEEVKKKNEKENNEESSSNGGKIKKNSSVDSGNEASSEDSNDSTTRSSLPKNENSNSGKTSMHISNSRVPLRECAATYLELFCTLFVPCWFFFGFYNNFCW